MQIVIIISFSQANLYCIYKLTVFDLYLKKRIYINPKEYVHYSIILFSLTKPFQTQIELKYLNKQFQMCSSVRLITHN